MELEPRTTAPAHATGAVEFVSLAAVDGDTTFQLRDAADVSALAASIGRLGQLVPLEVRALPAAEGVPGRYQVVCGFRRLAALRLLLRERVLVRVHRGLSEEDAWALALSQALLAEPLDRAALETLRARRGAGEGAASWAEELVDEALVRAPVDPEVRERFLAFLSGGEPASVSEPGADADSGADSGASAGEEEVEVTPEELAHDLAARLYQVNADLAVAYEAWADLPAEGRRMIVEQARWIAGILPGLEEEDP